MQEGLLPALKLLALHLLAENCSAAMAAQLLLC